MKKIILYSAVGALIFSGFFLLSSALAMVVYITAVGGLVAVLFYHISDQDSEIKSLRKRISNFYNDPTHALSPLPKAQADDLQLMKELVERLGHSDEVPLTLTADNTATKHYSAGEIYKMVKDALKSDRIEVLLQPVVSLPQRKPIAYECYSHIRFDENSSISAQDFMDVATSEGLMGAVDNIMLFRAIQMVRKSLKRDAFIPFFCNVSEYSVANSEFVESLCEFISSHKELLPSLILELNEGTLFSKSRFVRRGLETLVDTGCQFSLHQLDHTKIDMETLVAKDVRYVKFDGATLYASTKTHHIESFAHQLHENGIKFIATHIESEDMANQCVQSHISMAQGYLFSAPKSIAV